MSVNETAFSFILHSVDKIILKNKIFQNNIIITEVDVHHETKINLVCFLHCSSGLACPDFGQDSRRYEWDKKQTTSSSFTPPGVLCRNDRSGPGIRCSCYGIWNTCCHKIRNQERYLLYLLYIDIWMVFCYNPMIFIIYNYHFLVIFTLLLYLIFLKTY